MPLMELLPAMVSAFGLWIFFIMILVDIDVEVKLGTFAMMLIMGYLVLVPTAHFWLEVLS